MKKRLCAVLTAMTLSVGAIHVSAAGVAYLPGVTGAMSDSTYWAQEQTVLMSTAEITQRNAMTIAAQGTNMYDLKNQPETVDGVALNAALLKSAQADIAYYLGWTYLDGNEPATEADFATFASNTQNPNPQTGQPVRYGIAVNRTALRAFPSPKAILDNPRDKEFDYQYLSGVRVNEPLVITSVSADGNYYLAKNVCCSGWVPAEDVAVCRDKTQWLAAWDIAPDKALVVYGDKVYTEQSITGAQTANRMLTMGTVLEQAEVSDPNAMIDNRAAYQNYVVWMPIRTADGGYEKKMTLISEHSKVSDGYLPLTKSNLAKVALNALGNTYGWGGSLFSDDCSAYVRNVYKCFGLELARNTTWQTAMPMAKTDMQYMCREERMAVLDALPIGAILYFKGHEMLYLGKKNDQYYVTSSISTIMQPENPSVYQNIRSIVISTLDIKRANGNSWLNDLTMALIPYQTAEQSDLPTTMWYHDGVAFCLQNKLMQGDENKYFHPDENITGAELLQILWNREGKPGATEQAADKKWYADAAAWAQENALIPEEDPTFGLETALVREQIASVLYRYAKAQGAVAAESNGTELAGYSDAGEIANYAAEAMQYVAANGWMGGKTATTINPKDCTTRAEVAVMLKRVMQSLDAEKEQKA